jgi:hypothetical protein
LSARLLAAHTLNYKYEDIRHHNMIFGVEHVLNDLAVVPKLIAPFNGVFAFPFESVLTQVFLTLKPSAEGVHKSVQVIKACELSSTLLEQWLRLYAIDRKQFFLAPNLDQKTIQALIRLDPLCELTFIEERGELLAATLVVDPSLGRQLMWSQKPSLILNRLQKLHSPAPAADTPMRLGLVGLSVQAQGCEEQLRKVFSALPYFAWHRGFHGLAFRDEAPSLLKNLSLDMFEFRRRVFVGYGPLFSGKNEFESQLKAGKVRIRLENHFL